MRFLPILLLLFSSHLWAQTDLTAEITLPTKNAKGTLMLALCPDAGSFADEMGGVLRKAEASGTVMNVKFENVAPGTYAIKVFLDQNGNGKLDVNAKGFPQEPFGFSNDVFGRPGPALFNKAAIAVGKETTVTKIRLRD